MDVLRSIKKRICVGDLTLLFFLFSSFSLSLDFGGGPSISLAPSRWKKTHTRTVYNRRVSPSFRPILRFPPFLGPYVLLPLAPFSPLSHPAPFAPPLRSRIEYSKVKPEVCEGYKKQKSKKMGSRKKEGAREYKMKKSCNRLRRALFSRKKVKISKSKRFNPSFPPFPPVNARENAKGCRKGKIYMLFVHGGCPVCYAPFAMLSNF